MTIQSKRPIPKFSDPPVTETVLGVEFEPLEKWGIPYFGLFWERIRTQFPKFAVRPPLDSQIEQFDKPKLATGPQFQILAEPEVRCWFIASDDRTLVQVQGSRFTYNWRKTRVADAYPHFDDSVRPAFVRVWDAFADFVQQQNLGQVNAIQCEVTYINHLEIGKGWKSAADLSRVFPFWSGKMNGEFLPEAEGVAFDVAFRMPDQKGRLRVSLKPAIRTEDGTEVLQLTLTARGRPSGNDSGSVMAWLDLGREWVVRGFADFTSPQMHSLWHRLV